MNMIQKYQNPKQKILPKDQSSNEKLHLICLLKMNKNGYQNSDPYLENLNPTEFQKKIRFQTCHIQID